MSRKKFHPAPIRYETVQALRSKTTLYQQYLADGSQYKMTFPEYAKKHERKKRK